MKKIIGLSLVLGLSLLAVTGCKPVAGVGIYDLVKIEVKIEVNVSTSGSCNRSAMDFIIDKFELKSTGELVYEGSTVGTFELALSEINFIKYTLENRSLCFVDNSYFILLEDKSGIKLKCTFNSASNLLKIEYIHKK